MSHFGLTTTVQDLQMVGVDGGTFCLSGTWTNTAANGDEVSRTSTATSTTVDSVNFTFLGTYTSTGGTGRFADATLTIEVTGTSTRLSLDGTVATAFDEVTGVGTLSYGPARAEGTETLRWSERRRTPAFVQYDGKAPHIRGLRL